MLTSDMAVFNILGAVLFLTMIVFDFTFWNILYCIILFCYFLKYKFF